MVACSERGDVWTGIAGVSFLAFALFISFLRVFPLCLGWLKYHWSFVILADGVFR
jgi:hypothetical protein